MMRYLIPAFVMVSASLSFSAETVHLYLRGDHQGPILGDSTITSLGRADSIECVEYTHMLFAEPDPKSGITGTVQNHFPLAITKRLDRATPGLFEAWRNHEQLEAEFRFFRPDPSGTGETQLFYKVFLRNAYVAGIRQEVPNCMDPVNSSYPPVERVSFTYSAIEIVWMPTDDAVGDEWSANVTKVPFSDVNFDGIVNMKDFVILADDWLTQY